jgi:hypothetical protein
MPGPTPKDPSVRARRNRSSTRRSLQPRTGVKLTLLEGQVPELPEGPVWHSETERWWNDVWSSPMAPAWDASDFHNVTICALFYNDLWTAESSTARREAASEFRMHRRDLGLTPLDRRRLEWSIETADAAKDRGRQRRGEAPRDRLKVTAIEGHTDPREVFRTDAMEHRLASSGEDSTGGAGA